MESFAQNAAAENAIVEPFILARVQPIAADLPQLPLMGKEEANEPQGRALQHRGEWPGQDGSAGLRAFADRAALVSS